MAGRFLPFHPVKGPVKPAVSPFDMKKSTSISGRARPPKAARNSEYSNSQLLRVLMAFNRGDFLRTSKIVNTMVDQLGAFASEVTRVAREVGTEGKLGGQARVKGVAGTWKDLTENVNLMAGNLTAQVRNIATVTTAVANGNL